MKNLQLEEVSIGLAKKFIRLYCKILWKKPNEIFGQPNNLQVPLCFSHLLETNKWTLRSLQIISLKEFMDGLIELVSLLRLDAKS